MATLEDEIKDLRERNNELVQKVQHWKITAAQRENEKLDLMKEINDLRLKLSRIRSGGAAEARKLDNAIQSTTEEALSHLVHASSAVARTIELAKNYIRDRQDLDDALPRWSSISGTPTTDRIHRVPPLTMDGMSLQPVVSLSRTVLNSSRNTTRSPNQNLNISERVRAVPMHMLQDVYIPLTRIDAANFPSNEMDTDNDSNDVEDSTEDLGLEDSVGDPMDDSNELTEIADYERSRVLDVVAEDVEPEDMLTPQPRRIDNPLEGPSWLLDLQQAQISSRSRSRVRTNSEPDSTTEIGDNHTPPATSQLPEGIERPRAPRESPRGSSVFSPTLRRRQRTCSPPDAFTPARTPARSPRPDRRSSFKLRNSGRVLKVMVPRMRLEGPSPNGATVAGLIVSDSPKESPRRVSTGEPLLGNVSRRGSKHSQRESANTSPTHLNILEALARLCDRRASDGASSSVAGASGANLTADSRDDSDSGSASERGGEGRSRRARKAVTYKEVSLNRKLRRT